LLQKSYHIGIRLCLVLAPIQEWPAVSASTPRQFLWQIITIGTLLVGYSGYYVCRSVLPVVSNQMMSDSQLGFSEVQYGLLGTVGIIAYAVGKLFGGYFAGAVSSRVLFLAGMILSVVCVACFGFADGMAMILITWGANRFVQAQGWAGVVSIGQRWTTPAMRGKVMGILTLSYLFGDSLARLYLGLFIKFGLSWQAVVWVAAATLGGLSIVTLFLLKPSPSRLIGLVEYDSSASAADEVAQKRLSYWGILRSLFTRPAFYLVCGINMGLTTVRETFNTWTPKYLLQVVGLAPEDCAWLSACFPLAGAIAALFAGFSIDKLNGRFGAFMVASLSAGVVSMLAVACFDFRDRPVLAIGITSAVALFIMGPYTFCSGALAQKLGGVHGAGVAANLIDCAGYALGSIISGLLAGWMIQQFGFTTLLGLLVGLLIATQFVACLFWWHEYQDQLAKRELLGRP
jgi:MFS transporter, OPA family, glycerol-3-phosphate transporter